MVPMQLPAWDQAGLALAHAARAPWLDNVLVVVTWLGSLAVLLPPVGTGSGAGASAGAAAAAGAAARAGALDGGVGRYLRLDGGPAPATAAQLAGLLAGGAGSGGQLGGLEGSSSEQQQQSETAAPPQKRAKKVDAFGDFSGWS
jgi:hypothetical protein